MKLKTLENSILKDFTYYHIVLFQESDKPGKDYPNAYKTQHGAEKAAEKLLYSGYYHTIVIRREEIISQIPHVEYYSINSPIKTLKKEA